MPLDIEHAMTPHGDRAPDCTMVIFGGGGDLTKRLLAPALYNLARTGLLPARFALIGVDKLDMDDAGFRAHLDKAIRDFASDKHYAQTLDENALSALLERVHFLSGDFGEDDTYHRLDRMIVGISKDRHQSDHVLF
jgi:glucose-6-phosphate 1-dehydrogenase